MSDIFNELKEYCNSNQTEEVCGLIYRRNNQRFFQKCQNISENKQHNFLIKAIDYAKAEDLGTIDAIFHSHVGDNLDFSPIDYQVSFNFDLDSILFCTKIQTFKFLNKNNNQYIRYLGKEFDENNNNCLHLIRNFYSNELNFNIADVLKGRNKSFLDSQRTILSTKSYRFMASDNKLKIKSKEPNNFDILLFDIDNHLHLGIFLEPNFILHQPRKKLSCIESLENMQKYLVTIFTRKNE